MNLKNLSTEENKTKILGLLTILILLWLVLYFIPELFASLFNTVLGNLILLMTVLFTYVNNRNYGIITGLIIIIIYRFSRITITKEGFTKKSVQDFLQIQNTINKNTVFDMNVINTQATQQELDYFNNNGMWPWSSKVIELYQESIHKNPYVRSVPEQSTNQARTVYNESAILRILSNQSTEGQFLINGIEINDLSGNIYEELPNGFGSFAYESGLIKNKTTNTIKCNTTDSDNPYLERTIYTGKGGIYNEQTQKRERLDYNNLENIIPGFSFISEPCDPCGSQSSIPDYSCKYKIKIKDKPDIINKVWKYLWGIN